MLRYVLFVLVLLSHVLHSAPLAWSKNEYRSATVKRSVAGKVTSSKRKAVSATSRKAVRSNNAQRQRKSVVRARKSTAITARAVRGPHKAAYLRRPRTALVERARPDVIDARAAPDSLSLSANAAFVFDPHSAEVLLSKNAGEVLPIASITKLMTALVVVEAGQDMDEVLTVTEEDIDRIKHTSSRLRIGAKLTRANMLHIALMSSENRAASALGRHYPGGLPAFVAAMNAKAKHLGMTNTRYVEPTGLSSHNVSTANDLAKLVVAAQAHPIIRSYSTNRAYTVTPGGRVLKYRNSNRLVSSSGWDILLQKTGYIAEAGRCLVMNAVIDGRPIVMVFLDAKGKFARAADASRVRRWLERNAM